MATLVLSTIGSAIGGPIGQTIGALIGNQIDKAIFAPGGSREGPRLKELALTTSSYGQPIARQFGRMRVGGTVIWATDINETSAREGVGKGQTSTTTYSYSVSFAVALSSTALARVGRVWADGNLLRGENGDLKVEGAMRFYRGDGDSPVDPLIAADKGALAPAFRDCAYVVFEDLALADYGNRIPALTFEVFATNEDSVAIEQLLPGSAQARQPSLLTHARGFADEGGAVGRTLAAINEVLPLSCVITADGLRITTIDNASIAVRPLPERLIEIDDSEARERPNQRLQNADAAPLALRYYDEDRDYQPGVQRAVGMRPNGFENLIDLPATMTASGARQLANHNAQRARWRGERKTWLTAVLDEEHRPGALVTVPDAPGIWRVVGWEWHDRGIELELERMPPHSDFTIAADSGALQTPVDLIAPATILDFLEVPPESAANPSAPQVYAAATAQNRAWRGASLFVEQGNALVTIASAAPARAVMGQTLEPLVSSDAMLFEPAAQVLVELAGSDLQLEPSDLAGLASGTNRLMIGSEVLQFADAQPLGDRLWQLSGLLRGRAGTEDHAATGHLSGAPIVLLDNRLTPVDPALAAVQMAQRMAALGRGDSEPVFAELRNAGLSRRPPSPVHPLIDQDADLNWHMCWTRRARGAWIWLNGVEVPLVEESEQYRIGCGDTSAPYTTWMTGTAEITLSASERAALVGQFGPAALWVQQVGTFGASVPVFLANLD